MPAAAALDFLVPSLGPLLGGKPLALRDGVEADAIFSKARVGREYDASQQCSVSLGWYGYVDDQRRRCAQDQMGSEKLKGTLSCAEALKASGMDRFGWDKRGHGLVMKSTGQQQS